MPRGKAQRLAKSGPTPIAVGAPPLSCPSRGLSFLRPGEWEKAERPLAGDGANPLVTPQQELGARSARVIHQRDCPLPACVGRNASTFYLYPPRRAWWEAKVQHRMSKTKTGRKERAGSVPWNPGRSARWVLEGQGMWLLPAHAEPVECQLRACGEGGWLGFLLHSGCSLRGICLRGSRGWGGGGEAFSLIHQPGWVFLRLLLPGSSPKAGEG